MQKYLSREYILRCVVVVIAMIFNGLGLAIMRISCMGTDPYSSMNYSFSEYFGIPLGTVVMIVCAILLIVMFIFMKEALGFGTIANMLLLGNAADMWSNLLIELSGNLFDFLGKEQLLLRLVLVCVGILCMVFFNSFCISAQVGIATYDSLGYIVERNTRISFQWARILLDSICVIVAYIVGRQNGIQWELIGVGTVIMAFGTGPLITWIRKHISDPFVSKVVKQYI